jgi:hypothetical protein
MISYAITLAMLPTTNAPSHPPHGHTKRVPHHDTGQHNDTIQRRYAIIIFLMIPSLVNLFLGILDFVWKDPYYNFCLGPKILERGLQRVI